MSANFIENESYLHKKAKEVLKEWFDCDVGKYSECIGDISFCSNRKSGVWLEYPICELRGTTSWDTNWDEIVADTDFDNYDEKICGKKPEIIQNTYYDHDKNKLETYKCLDLQEWVPTFDQCVKMYNVYPSAVIDVVCTHKGCPKYAIEICHTNPVSQEKIDKLKVIGVENLLEIDAYWILKQTKIPSQLKYKRLI